MKTRAFTLVELLVVVAITVLLMSLLVPAVGGARSLARSAKCRSNLHQIAVGYSAARLSRVSTDNGCYPAAASWPIVPMSTVNDDRVFICPEDQRTLMRRAMTPREALSHLMYVNITGTYSRSLHIRFDDPQHQGSGHMNLGTLEGSDATGNTIDIGLDDNEPVSLPRSDNHDGLIRICQDPNGRTYAKLVNYNCGEYNAVLLDGKPLFTSSADPPGVNQPGSEMYGWLGPGTSKNGMEVDLSVKICSYAVTSLAGQMPYGQRKILAMDSLVSVVDPTLADAPQHLWDGARHRGRLNLLMADGSVDGGTPEAINPLIGTNLADQWQP